MGAITDRFCITTLNTIASEPIHSNDCRLHANSPDVACFRAANEHAAYIGMMAAGHAAVAMFHGLPVHRLVAPPNLAEAGCCTIVRVEVGPDGDPAKRIEAGVAGPIATELFCEILDDEEHCLSHAFYDALDEAWRDGLISMANFADDFDASLHCAERCWVPALERALGLLREPGPRRAACAIAARLLREPARPIERDELLQLVEATTHLVAALARLPICSIRR